MVEVAGQGEGGDMGVGTREWERRKGDWQGTAGREIGKALEWERRKQSLPTL